MSTADAYTNCDPGHYLDNVCTILVAYRPGSNWAYYGAHPSIEWMPGHASFVDSVQSRAIVNGCRSTSFGDRSYLLGHLMRNPDVQVTAAGLEWLAVGSCYATIARMLSLR